MLADGHSNSATDKCMRLDQRRGRGPPFLRNLPDGLVDGFDDGRNAGDALDGAIVCDDHVLHVVVPQSETNEFAETGRRSGIPQKGHGECKCCCQFT